MNRTNIKQVISRLLRKTRLLGVADYIMFLIAARKQSASNRRFVLDNPNIKTPPVHILYDALHNCNFGEYYQSGTPDAKLIIDTVRKYKPTEAIAIMEWGCGPARVIQHLSKVDSNLQKIIGTDYNRDTINWCRKSFSNIEFYENGLAPPLPLKDKSVDVIYAISVFTHLSESMHYAWVNELLRVLKPGGLLLATLHGEKKIGSLLPDELSRFNKGEIVVRSNVEEGKKHFLAYHSDKFVRNKLLSKFSKVDHIDSPNMHQDIWVGVAP